MVETTHQSPESKPMPDIRPRLMDQKVLSHADNCLAPHLPLEAEGYACTTDDLLKVVLGVATNQGTIESVCVDLLSTPVGPHAKCGVRTGDASALRAATAVLAKREDGRSRPPPPTA